LSDRAPFADRIVAQVYRCNAPLANCAPDPFGMRE